VSKPLDKLLSILESEYGYPVSENLETNTVKHDEAIQLDILTESHVVFASGIIISPKSNIDGVSFLKSILNELPSCMLGFVYDEVNLVGYKFRSKDSELVKLRSFEIYKFSTKSQVYGHRKDHLPLIPISEKLESVFFQAHSHIRDIDGLHADEALDELCKIIYTKLYDEENTLVKHSYRFQKNIYGNESELGTSIYDLYREANEYDKRVYSLKIPGYKRSRGVFDQPIKLSSSALSKVIQEFQKFDFTSTPLDIKGRAFQNVFLPALRAGMGQYFTPDPIIKLIVQSSNPNFRHLILDPFCGSGHFLTESLDFIRKNETKQKVIDEFAYYKLHGIEKSERMVRIAMTDMRLHGDGHANIRCTDALLSFDNYHDIEENSFDYVFTNPPFGSILSEDAINSLGSFELATKKHKVPLEVLGLERSIKFLKESGKLAIVLPESILVNSSMLYVREWLKKCVTINAVISLPVETFSPFGANIKTSILFMTKTPATKNNSIYCGIVNNIGYDASGRNRPSDDIKPLVKILRKHLANEGWS